MEGKGVSAVIIMGLLILGLVVTQIEAYKSCCRNTNGRNCYDACRKNYSTMLNCGNQCDCIFISLYDDAYPNCPASHPFSSMLESSGAMSNEYCKLGCASSVCDTLTTNQNSDVGEGEVKEAVDHCYNACSELCIKGAKTALASA